MNEIKLNSNICSPCPYYITFIHNNKKDCLKRIKELDGYIIYNSKIPSKCPVEEIHCTGEALGEVMLK